MKVVVLFQGCVDLLVTRNINFNRVMVLPSDHQGPKDRHHEMIIRLYLALRQRGHGVVVAHYSVEFGHIVDVPSRFKIFQIPSTLDHPFNRV